MLTPLPGNRGPFNRMANRDVQTTGSYFKCEVVLLRKKKISEGSKIFLFFFLYLLEICLLLLGRQAEVPLQCGVVLLRLLVELLLPLLQGEETASPKRSRLLGTSGTEAGASGSPLGGGLAASVCPPDLKGPAKGLLQVIKVA